MYSNCYGTLYNGFTDPEDLIKLKSTSEYSALHCQKNNQWLRTTASRLDNL